MSRRQQLAQRGIKMAGQNQAVFCDAVGILPYPAHALIDWEHGMIGIYSTNILDFVYHSLYP